MNHTRSRGLHVLAEPTEHYNPRPPSRNGHNNGLSPGWTRVPHFLLTDTRLSHSARLLMMVLLAHDYRQEKGRCWPSQRRLAELLGVTGRQVRYLLAELMAADYITAERIGRSNSYSILVQANPVPPSKKYPQPPAPLLVYKR